MFEQSLLTTGPATRKTSAVFASFSAQILGIGVLICVPLIYNDVLPQIKLSKPLAWRVSAPPPPEAVPQAQQRTATPSPLHADSIVPVFRPPVRNSASGQQAAALLDLPGTTGVPTSDGPLIGLPPSATPLPRIDKPKPPIDVSTVQKPPEPPLTVGGDVQAAKIIKRVLPLYPQLAKQARVSGRVQLSGVIAKDGTVQKLQVISGPALLVKAAVDAVSQWIYRPTYLNGQPVEVIAPIDVIFTLQ